LLRRSIDFHSGPTLDQRLFGHFKRLCVGGAVLAAAVGALDLMNMRPVEAASEIVHDQQKAMADLPDAALATLRSWSATIVEKSQLASFLSREAPKDSERAPGMLAKAKTTSATRTAALARPQGVEVAMLTSSRDSATRVMPETPPLQLASLGPVPLPSETKPESLSATPVELPPVLSVLPPPAPGVPPPSPIEQLHLEGKSLARAERCLANAIYFEARDQPYKGQVAVAQVVINRAFSGYYPEDICGVVYQNADHHLACQFTFACDGKRKTIGERGAWARANRIAKDALAGKAYEQAVGTATHYHAFYVHPNWVREMKKLVRFGEHSFYRPFAWGNGSDEPVWSVLALKKKTATATR
jgi:Cell Wall Hydrolase